MSAAGFAAAGCEDVYAPTNQFRRHCGQLVVLAMRKSVLDLDVLTFDKSMLGESAADCGDQMRSITWDLALR